MIQELNEKNLAELGFNTDEVKTLLSKDTYTNITNNKGCFFIDNKEGKIYTDTDKHKHLLLKQGLNIFPFSFPELISEYFDKHLKAYLKEQQSLFGNKFDNEEETKAFIIQEIENIKQIIEKNEKDINASPQRELTSKKRAVKTHKKYISILEKKLTKLEQPQQEKQEVLIDYSDSKITEKIIALNEAGILDFLKTKQPFDMSVNSLANFLSLCIGEKSSSIQPCLNAMFKKENAQKNNPYKTTNTVEKTKYKLIQIGLKIE